MPAFAEPYPGFSDESKGPLIVVVTATVTAVALLFVMARIYSRLISVGKLAVDDYIVILSIVCSLPSLRTLQGRRRRADLFSYLTDPRHRLRRHGRRCGS